MEQFLSIIKAALRSVLFPGSTWRISPAPILWFCVPFAIELNKLSEESGSIKIRACDTMGFGVSYPGVALPRVFQG